MINMGVRNTKTKELTPHKYLVVDSTGLVSFISFLSSISGETGIDTNNDKNSADINDDKGETDMNDDENVTFKDLKIVEGKLNSKIDVSNAKLSGKIDTSEAKLSGKIDVTNAKLDSLNDKLADQATRLNWLMGLVIGSILVPIAIKLIFK